MERIIWRGGKGRGGKGRGKDGRKGRGKDGRKGRGKDGRKGGGKGRGKEEVQEESGSFEDVKAEEQDDEALKPWAQRRRELRREKRRSGAVAWNEEDWSSEDESDWGTWSGLRRAGPQGGRLEEDWSNGKGRGKDGGKGELARDNRIKAAREAYNALRLKTRETLEEDKKQKEEADAKIEMLRAATAADREEVKRIRQQIAESQRVRKEARLEAARKVREAAAAHGPSPARSPRNVAMSAQGQPSWSPPAQRLLEARTKRRPQPSSVPAPKPMSSSRPASPSLDPEADDDAQVDVVDAVEDVPTTTRSFASAASVGRIAKMELQVQQVAQTRRSSSSSTIPLGMNIRRGRKRQRQNVNSEAQVDAVEASAGYDGNINDDAVVQASLGDTDSDAGTAVDVTICLRVGCARPGQAIFAGFCCMRCQMGFRFHGYKCSGPPSGLGAQHPLASIRRFDR